MPKILITGASGFIGSFLVEHGLELNAEVWAAVRPTSSRRYLRDPRIRFIELDLSSDDRLKEQLTDHVAGHEPFDYVIHAAGATKCRRSADFDRTNAEGTLRLALTLLETQALRPGGRFVFISSLSVCGPVHEIDFRPISEADTPLPNTAYGRSKLLAEQYLRDIPDLNYVVLRPTGVYGPRERDYYLMARSISRHVDFAVGFKPQVLSFIYVVIIRKDRLLPKREAPKFLGAICETAGQFAYIYAIADTEHLAMSAPIISAYCAASVLWSRLFLKEKLSWKHYLMIALVVIGIVIMGVFDL